MTAAETPVLDTLAAITAISLERCALPPRELMLARIAALIAVDAPPASYLANAGAAADSGITGDDVQAIMIGIAPVVGTARVVASAGNIFRALGFAIMAAEAELAEPPTPDSSPGSDTPVCPARLGRSCFAVLRCCPVRRSWRRAGDGQVRDLGG